MRDTRSLVTLEPSLSLKALLDRVAAPATSPLPSPRLLLVLAHPDDEVLAFGGRLERLSNSRLLTATDGTPSDGADARHHGFASLDAYRAARQRELACALQHAGLQPELLLAPSAGSPLPVPDQTAALHLVTLTLAVLEEISGFAPEAVFTHPYEGGHPDHDACAYAVHAAVRLLADGGTPEAPQGSLPIFEAAYYHRKVKGFDGAQSPMQTGSFLDTWTSPETRVCELSLAEQSNKRARLSCFASQTETLAQFAAEREIYRAAPVYDFAQPPHPGTLFYEQFPWGMTGERFRELALEATTQLHLLKQRGAAGLPISGTSPRG